MPTRQKAPVKKEDGSVDAPRSSRVEVDAFLTRLTRGAYCRFDAGSSQQLRNLLSAVAVYATGGQKALRDYGAATNNSAAVRLLEQLS